MQRAWNGRGPMNTCSSLSCTSLLHFAQEPTTLAAPQNV
eukprot:CAMPEP_0177685776 /NCGR_PEP_ID=MMETSP0447-20121125/33216_1 /TAXON_ID=0 /ORGANISM="Stygamoeba regulata, Strain BSH-02190019" /LENGTH=38 /DNA_ID= /DNA_START= /DNA_END= /DNA_ORIENTATION=